MSKKKSLRRIKRMGLSQWPWRLLWKLCRTQKLPPDFSKIKTRDRVLSPKVTSTISARTKKKHCVWQISTLSVKSPTKSGTTPYARQTMAASARYRWSTPTAVLTISWATNPLLIEKGIWSRRYLAVQYTGRSQPLGHRWGGLSCPKVARDHLTRRIGWLSRRPTRHCSLLSR